MSTSTVTELPNCRLFLMPPSDLDAAAIAACVAAAAQAGDVACLVLPPQKALIGEVMPTAHGHDIAVLVHDDVRIAAYASADGVHITTSLEDAEAARKTLGRDASIGLAASGSRHEAMLAGEGAIDYIAFDVSNAAGADLLRWWTPLFQVPSVALNAPDMTACENAIADGADFLMPPSDMWTSTEAAARLATDLTKAGERQPA